MTAKPRNTTKFRLDPAHPPALTPAQAERLKAIPIDYSDILELPDDFWTQHPPAKRETKTQLTLRLNTSVLEFFRSQGPRYQTRINNVLVSYVNAMHAHGIPHGLRRTQGKARVTRSRSTTAYGGRERPQRPKGRG